MGKEVLALFPTESTFRCRGGVVSASDSWLCWVPPMIACQGCWATCQLLSCGGHCGRSVGGSSVTTEELHCLWEVGLELVPAVREGSTQGCGAQRNDNVQCLNRKVDQRSSMVSTGWKKVVLRAWVLSRPPGLSSYEGPSWPTFGGWYSGSWDSCLQFYVRIKRSGSCYMSNLETTSIVLSV